MFDNFVIEIIFDPLKYSLSVLNKYSTVQYFQPQIWNLLMISISTDQKSKIHVDQDNLYLI